MKNLAFLMLALALAACATPPARYDAFAEAMRDYSSSTTREAERVQLLQPPPVVDTPAPVAAAPRSLRRSAARSAGRSAGRPAGQSAGRPVGRRVATLAAPPVSPGVPDCRNTASLTPAGRERCGLTERLALTALANRHAQALAGYASSMALLATRFDATPAMPALETSRAEVLELGEQLEASLAIPFEMREPFRAIPARVGLRPAFAQEMATHGWKIRQQLELQALALERLEANRGGQTDDAVQRLRWSLSYLRSAFDRITISDGDALPEIARARQALGS